MQIFIENPTCFQAVFLYFLSLSLSLSQTSWTHHSLKSTRQKKRDSALGLVNFFSSFLSFFQLCKVKKGFKLFQLEHESTFSFFLSPFDRFHLSLFLFFSFLFPMPTFIFRKQEFFFFSFRLAIELFQIKKINFSLPSKIFFLFKKGYNKTEKEREMNIWNVKVCFSIANRIHHSQKWHFNYCFTQEFSYLIILHRISYWKQLKNSSKFQDEERFLKWFIFLVLTLTFWKEETEVKIRMKKSERLFKESGKFFLFEYHVWLWYDDSFETLKGSQNTFKLNLRTKATKELELFFLSVAIMWFGKDLPQKKRHKTPKAMEFFVNILFKLLDGKQLWCLPDKHNPIDSHPWASYVWPILPVCPEM